MEYTKGEWKVYHNKHGWHCDVDGVGRVCMIDTEANARLIASAPDLYEACKYIKSEVRLAHYTGDVYECPHCKLEKAIAKAEKGT